MDIRENIPIVENVIRAVVPSHNRFQLAIDEETTGFNGEWLYIRLKYQENYLKKIYYYIAGERELVDNHRLEENIRSGRMAVSSLSAEDYRRNGGIALRRNRLPEKALIHIAGEFVLPDDQIRYVFAAPWLADNRRKQLIRYAISWAKAGPPWGRHSIRSGCRLRITCGSGDTPELKLAYCHNRDIPGDPEGLGTEIIHTIPAKTGGYPNGVYEVLLDDSIWQKMENGTQLRLLPKRAEQNQYDVRPDDSAALKVPDRSR